METPAMDKQSSLIQAFINYGLKKFSNINPWLELDYRVKLHLHVRFQTTKWAISKRLNRPTHETPDINRAIVSLLAGCSRNCSGRYDIRPGSGRPPICQWIFHFPDYDVTAGEEGVGAVDPVETKLEVGKKNLSYKSVENAKLCIKCC